MTGTNRSTVSLSGPTSALEWKALMEAYDDYGKGHRDLEDTTLACYKWYLEKLSAWLMEESGLSELREFDFQALCKFLSAYGKTRSSEACRGMYAPLKSFLRFCHVLGYVEMDLTSGVPSVRKTSLGKVPFILSDETVSQLLQTIDRQTMVGCRDDAIIRILLTYGVRGIQVRNMRLEDIHWRTNRLLFRPAKKGKAIEQPLEPEVGNALLEYVQNFRPRKTGHEEVFLTAWSNCKPLTQATLSAMMTRRLARIGVGIEVRKGSHILRHFFASKWLRNGIPLAHIGEMLGHRSESSTLIYTHIDFDNLMSIAQEWPEMEVLT